MSICVNVQLDDVVVPSVPFLWYREQETLCPIEKITFDKNLFTVTQRNILDNKNIYICMHSLLYYVLNKNNGGNLLVIPNNFRCNVPFNVVINELGYKMVTGDGLKVGIRQNGPVFIHDLAFSPTGFPYFKVNMNNKINKIMCNIKCDGLGINVNCLFILINDVV